MARSRNIKPGFFKNEDLADCDPLARILFAGLWTIADREGRLEDRPKRIKAELLPYDNVDGDALLSQLAERGFIVRYCVNGQGYLSIPTFTKNQQPHVNEAQSTIPAPPDSVLNKEEYHTSTVQVPEEHGANSPLTLTLNSSSLNSESLREHPAAAASESAPMAEEKETNAIETQFEQFWQIYPRRDGTRRGSKADALAVFRTKMRSMERALAIEKVAIYARLESTRREGGKFIPDAERWLREKRWQTVDEEAQAERAKATGVQGYGINQGYNPAISTTAANGKRPISLGEAVAEHIAKTKTA